MASPWLLSELSGTVAALHGPLPDMPETPGTTGAVFVMRPDAGAVVLGSAQRETVLAESVLHGTPGVCRRHSGGGLVVIEPGACCWVDVLVPTDHELHRDDVHLAFDWLGDTWVRALTSLRAATGSNDASSIRAHIGRGERPDAGRIVCFAGLGRGEVVVGGRKLVGISQRRTRRGSRFQCVVYSRFDVASHLALLRSPTDRSVVEAPLRDLVATCGDLDALVAAFCSALPPRT